MKLHNILISLVLTLCLLANVCIAVDQGVNPAAPVENQANNTSNQAGNVGTQADQTKPHEQPNGNSANTPADQANKTSNQKIDVSEILSKLGSDGKNAKNAASQGQNKNKDYKGPVKGKQNLADVEPFVASGVSLTALPVTGKCIDNTKKIAVYMPRMTNPVAQVSTGGTIISTDIMYDPLCTAMFFEYNPAYLTDGTIGTNLKPANYDLLIVPMREMSNAAATAINTYLKNGGSVWFLNDPSFLPNGDLSDHRIKILGNPQYTEYNSITGSSSINVYDDEITSGLPSSFNPVGGAFAWNFFRELGPLTGKISGFDYKVLMSNGDCAMMIKYENTTTGARAIYSNPYMFVSGGDCSYFNSQTATKLFLQTKAWVLKMALNSGGVQVTYPKSDKQLTVTMDDVIGASWDDNRTQPMFDMENAHGMAPSSVNTFFITPDSNYTIKPRIEYYAANGDTHALHPHFGTVWDNNQTVSSYTTAINKNKALINKIMGVTNYGFTSWRFPYTSFCTNSMKAVSNTGFVIDSSSGSWTCGIPIGIQEVNNLLFPKQMVIGTVKANTIECELTSAFDTDAGSADNFYQYYNAVMPYLKNVNFPANFVVGVHFQQTGQLPDYTNALGQILDTSKNTGTSYATFDTLAKYITSKNGAQISASVDNGATIVTVTATKNIDNFTLKVTNMNTVSATYDGAAIPSSNIRQDGNVWYITQNVNVGTHSFVITA